MSFAQSHPIVLVPDNIIDGVHNEPRKGWKILIKDGLIHDIGSNISIPDEAEIISLNGKTILPGFIDMHGHIYANNGTNVQNEPAYLKLYLAGGVTTIFSPGEFYPEQTLELKRQVENSEILGPQIYTAGPYFDHRFEIFRNTKGKSNKIKTENLINEWQDKIDGIKVYERIAVDELQFLIQKAYSLGIPITGHLGSVTAKRAVELGIDGLEHGLLGIPDFFSDGENISSRVCSIAEINVESPKVNELIDLFVKNGVYLSPTIITFQSISPGFEPQTPEWKEYLSEDTRKDFVRTWAQMQGMLGNPDCWIKALQNQDLFLKKFYDKRGMLVTGTDPVGPVILPGFSLHAEVLNFVRLGLSPLDAIKAATINGAKALQKDNEIGSLEVGKRADLMVIEGNPLENISDIKRVVMVIKEGIQYDPQKLRNSAKGKVGTGKN